MDEVEYLGASGSLLSYNLYRYGNNFNNFKYSTFISYRKFNFMYGFEKFKRIIVNLFVKILAKFISVCPSTLSFVLSFLAMLIRLEIVANFSSAVYECLMEGKNGIEIYLKKSKWRFPYKITKEEK